MRKTSSVVVTVSGSGGGCSALPVYAVLVPDEVCGIPRTLVADDLYPRSVVSVLCVGGSMAILPYQPRLRLLPYILSAFSEYFVLRDSKAGCHSVPVGGALTVLTVDNVFCKLFSLVPVQLNASVQVPELGSLGRSPEPLRCTNPAQNQTMTLSRATTAQTSMFGKVAVGDRVRLLPILWCFRWNSKANTGRPRSLCCFNRLDIAVMEVLLNDDLKGAYWYSCSANGRPV